MRSSSRGAEAVEGRYTECPGQIRVGGTARHPTGDLHAQPSGDGLHSPEELLRRISEGPGRAAGCHLRPDDSTRPNRFKAFQAPEHLLLGLRGREPETDQGVGMVWHDVRARTAVDGTDVEENQRFGCRSVHLIHDRAHGDQLIHQLVDRGNAFARVESRVRGTTVNMQLKARAPIAPGLQRAIRMWGLESENAADTIERATERRLERWRTDLFITRDRDPHRTVVTACFLQHIQHRLDDDETRLHIKVAWPGNSAFVDPPRQLVQRAARPHSIGMADQQHRRFGCQPPSPREVSHDVAAALNTDSPHRATELDVPLGEDRDECVNRRGIRCWGLQDHELFESLENLAVASLDGTPDRALRGIRVIQLRNHMYVTKRQRVLIFTADRQEIRTVSSYKVELSKSSREKTPMATDTQLRVTIRELDTAADFLEAGELYRAVFGLQDEAFSVNPRLMSSLRRFGGSVIGARTEEGRLVAFAYGFLGIAGNEQFHYSQAVVVAPDHQHRGLGRAMKEEQKQIALRSDVTHMRWAFDPLLARNAHFNLDVLGATGRWFFDDFYDSRETDDGTPSNRMIVEWTLSNRKARRRETLPVPAEVADASTSWGGMLVTDDGTAWVPIPAMVTSHGTAADGHLAEVRAPLAASLTVLFNRGFVAVSCVRLDESSAVYRFAQTPQEVRE